MPTYDFRCVSCEAAFERVVSFAQAKEPQVCECGHTASRVLSPITFLLKGDEWAGKNIMIRGQMAEKNRRLDVKQSEQKRLAEKNTLTPNVAGEQVESWREAQSVAASKGLNTSSYDTLVRREAGAA